MPHRWYHSTCDWCLKLTEQQEARDIFAQGEEAVVFRRLLAAKLAAQGNPRGPPIAVRTPLLRHETDTSQAQRTTGKRKKKPGRKPGHVGTRRPKPLPEHVDAHEEHQADCCPDCGGPLNRCAETRQRYIEDIPEDLQPVVTEHVIHRDWCPQCQKNASSRRVPDALPRQPLGHRSVRCSAWLHYALGNTLAADYRCARFPPPASELTRGGLLQHVVPVARSALSRGTSRSNATRWISAVLHADETGWRVNGKTHWLWCFTTPRLTYYMIHRSPPDIPPLLEFFITEFAEFLLVSDFWGAYNARGCALYTTNLPGSPAARPETGGTVQKSEPALACVCEAVAATLGRRDPALATA